MDTDRILGDIVDVYRAGGGGGGMKKDLGFGGYDAFSSSPRGKSPKRPRKFTDDELRDFRRAHITSQAVKDARLASDDAYKAGLNMLAKDLRYRLADTNANIRAIKDRRTRNKAAKMNLWGGAPLKDLLNYQRSTISPRIFKQKRISPLIGVQAYANSLTGIGSATRCAAAVEASRRASKRRYNSELVDWQGNDKQLGAIDAALAGRYKRLEAAGKLYGQHKGGKHKAKNDYQRRR